MMKSGIISFTVRILAAPLSVALSVLLAQFLGAEEFGKYSFLASIFSLALVAIQLGFPTLVTRSYYQDDAAHQVVYTISLSLVWIVLATVIVIIIVVLIGTLSSDGLGSAVLFLPLILSAAALNNVGAGRLRALDRVFFSTLLEQLTKYLLPIPILLVGALILGVRWDAISTMWVLTFGYTMSAILAWTLGNRGDTLQIGFQSFRIFYINRSSLQSVWTTMASSFQIAVNKMFGVINQNLDILLITVFLGWTETGHYRVAVVISATILFFVPAVTNAYVTRILRQNREGSSEIQKTMTSAARLLFVISASTAIAISLTASLLVETMYGLDYIDALAPIVVLSLASGVKSGFGIGGYFLTITGHEKIVFRNTFVAVVFNIVGNIILIYQFGMIGAAIATGLSRLYVGVANWKSARLLLGVDCSILG
jgi:O-antigen/teichoic acid export membrane protein